MDLGELAGIESSAKTVKSLHFTQHYASSLSKGIFPIPTFLCNNLKVKGQKDQTCTQSHFQISVEVEFFSDINFSISMIYRFNSLALLRMRNAPTDKLLRHNVMLCVTMLWQTNGCSGDLGGPT